MIINNVNFYTGKTFETEHNRGKIPSPDLLKKKLKMIQEQYNEHSAEYDAAKKKSDRLARQIQKKRQSQKTLDRYLQNEQETFGCEHRPPTVQVNA